MMIWTAKLSKPKAAFFAACAVLAGLLLVIVLGLRGPGEAPQAQVLLASPEEQTAYLRSLGWEVEPEPVETLRFLLPETLEEPYLTYNALQKEQGLDLAPACGKQVERRTFTVTNYPGRPEGVQANLYLCEGVLTAGDILCTGADGFQSPLAFPEPAEGGS